MGLPPETQLQGAEPQVAPSTPLYKDCLEVATEHPYGTVACLWFPDNPQSHSSLIATVLAGWWQPQAESCLQTRPQPAL